MKLQTSSGRINNNLPHSPTQPVLDVSGIRATEAKYQLSLKTKAATNIFGDNGDLWLAYTQSSRWQIYAPGISRPFRETNYEPEALFVWKTNARWLGLDLRYAALGINHQSNGRADPLSRSWNRVIGQAGFEKDDWSLTLRAWRRLSERANEDNNPDITSYMGHGDLLVTRKLGTHLLTAQFHQPLSNHSNSHGSLRMDWASPISGKLSGHVQWFTGYGESMIDYNHKANYLGLGISLVELQ